MTKRHYPKVAICLASLLALAAFWLLGTGNSRQLNAQQPPSTQASETAAPTEEDASLNARKARQLLNLSLQSIVQRVPPFEAKLRQVTRVGDQEVRAVGRYIQSSYSRGLMRMDLQSKIGDRSSRFEQTCDGRLVWTREQIGDEVRIRRVTVGRLDEVSSTIGVPARLRVGGIPELLDSIVHDYDLKLISGTLNNDQRVVIVKGSLKGSTRRSVEDVHGKIPDQMPVSVRIAWLDEESTFQMVPTKIEFWGAKKSNDTGPLLPISVLDIYDVAEMPPPQEDRFRYNTTEQDANYTDETQRYIKRFQTRIALNPPGSSTRK